MLIQNESIKTEYKSLLDFGFEKKLIIPRIQRSYVWKESNLVDIKNELTKYIENENDEQNNDAFLMPMSAYDGETTRSICDGQQRLITINMLRALCKKYYEDNGDYDKAKEIRIFDIRYEDEDNEASYYKTMEHKPTKEFRNVYLELRNFIFDEYPDCVDLILDWTSKCYISATITNDPDTLYGLFERSNAGGEPVKVDVIIRDGLKYYAEKYKVNVDPDMYDNCVERVKSFGRIKLNEKLILQKERVVSVMNRTILASKENFLDFNDFCYGVKEANNTNLMYLVRKLNKRELGQVIEAYALKDHKNLDKDKDFQNKIFYPLINIYATSALLDKNPSKGLNALIDLVLEGIKSRHTLDEIREDLVKKINSEHLIYIHTIDEITKYCMRSSKSKDNIFTVFEMEAYLLNNHDVSFDLKTSNMTLEHIYPQSPRSDWKMNGYPMSVNEQNALIYNFGNMCLLNGSLNSSVQNAWIEDKEKEYATKIGSSYTYDFNKVDTSKMLTGKSGAEYINNRLKEKIEYMYNNFPICDIIFVKSEG